MIRLNILYYFTVKTEVNQSETEMLNISSMHIRKYYKKRSNNRNDPTKCQLVIFGKSKKKATN